MTQQKMMISRDQPVWQPLAADLIARLRLHHTGGDPSIFDTGRSTLDAEMAEDETLGALFARFQKDQAEEDQSVSAPCAPVPVRQLLTALRLAASFGSADVLATAQQLRAVTLLTDIDTSDLELVAQALKGCFPRASWTLLAPSSTDGTISKLHQERFWAAIETALDGVTATLILVPAGIKVPDHLRQADLPTFRFPSVTGDMLVAHLRAGGLGDTLTDEIAFRQELPDDSLLAELDTAHICTALRAPSLLDVIARLAAMTRTDHKDVTRLEDMTGDSPALLAARRLVADLLLWKEGTVAWTELSRSILFFGPPGTGKTWIARGMGVSAGIACVTGSFAEWQAAGHLGDLLREMRKSFSEARRRKPCVLFIDEIDAVGSRLGSDNHGRHYRTQVINGFLGEMNALVAEEGVIVVGACNQIQQIDPAIIRAGRFDLKIEVPLPDADQILGLLRQQLRKDLADPDLAALARAAVGRSPAEIDAAIRAARSSARHLRQVMTITMLRRHLKLDVDGEHPRILWRIAVHEAGHAVVAAALDLGMIESMKVTDHGGEIRRRNMQTESLLSDLEAEICYNVAGRAAERLVLGTISAGAGGPAASDLAMATERSLGIETIYGLGAEGPVWHDMPGSLMLQNSHLRGRVRQRIERAEVRAGKILARHRATLEGLARELLQQRSLARAGIQTHLREIPLAERPTAEQPDSRDDKQTTLTQTE